MSRNRDLERQLNGVSDRMRERVRHYADEAADRVRERARHYADETADTASDLIERGRRATARLNRRSNGYGRQLARFAEDMSDEASYQYRRARRHVSRHPVAATAIVAGTLTAFLVLRHMFRNRDDD